MRRTKEEAEVTRKQLLEAAVHVFSKKSYAATRLEDIADEAGVTRGAIYWHFGNKKELFIAIFKERVDPFFEIINEILQEDLRPLQKIEKILAVLFKKAERDKEFMVNQHLDFMEIKIRNEIPEILDLIYERAQKLSAMLAKIIKAGIAMGEIRADINPAAATGMVATLISGYGFLSARKEKRPLVKGKGQDIIQIFIQGIKA